VGGMERLHIFSRCRSQFAPDTLCSIFEVAETRPLTEPEAWRVALERGPQSCLFHAVNQLLWLLLAEAGHPGIVVVVVVFVVTMPLIIEHVPFFSVLGVLAIGVGL